VRPPLLDRTRPLSTTLAVGHRPGASRRKLGVLLVLHHAVADGLRGVKMITSLLDPTPDDRVDGVTGGPSPRTGRELVADNLRRRWEAVRRFSPVATAAIGAYAARAVPRIWWVRALHLTDRPDLAPPAIDRSEVSNRRASRGCPLTAARSTICLSPLSRQDARPAQRPRRMPRWTRAARLGSSWSPRRWK
jgi:Wax ester synthase-like Acyl-CoA acyltransferase domain